MPFTAKDVQSLRETTGAGMMDCKKALTETDGNMEQAVQFLREKGLAAAAKKASRIAAEGLVYACVAEDGTAVMVEVNSETDFAAKADPFVALVKDIASVVSEKAPRDVDDLLTKPYPGTDMTVEAALKEKVLVIGENMKIRRFARFDTPVNVAYVHMGGKIGVLINLDVSDELKDNPAVAELGRDIAMQAAAMRPLYLNRDGVDAEALEKEKEIYLAQAKEEGKPDNVAQKMVMGRINKYYSEVCLIDQPFVKDDKLSVGKYIDARAKELGGSIKLTAFERFERGEGLAKREDDFAAEVAKAAGK